MPHAWAQSGGSTVQPGAITQQLKLHIGMAEAKTVEGPLYVINQMSTIRVHYNVSFEITTLEPTLKKEHLGVSIQNVGETNGVKE